jgi:hypothetical protein
MGIHFTHRFSKVDTYFVAGELFSETDGHTHPRYQDLLGCCFNLWSSSDIFAGVNEGPRAVVLAFFKDFKGVPRDIRGSDLNDLSDALIELCCVCRSTVAFFHRHAAMVPKEVQKSLEDLGYGQKLQAALELLEADVKCWCQ